MGRFEGWEESAATLEVFNAENLDHTCERAAAGADRLAPTAPKLAELLTESEGEDLLALHLFRKPTGRSCSTDPRRGVLYDCFKIRLLVGALLIERHDK